MNDKSYVSLEQRVCLVCVTTFETGNLLLDNRLRPSMGRHTTTGWGLCPEHQRRFNEGYVALIECDPERSGVRPDVERVKAGDAYRTGRLAFVKRGAFARIFAKPISADRPCVFVEPGVLDRLQKEISSTD